MLTALSFVLGISGRVHTCMSRLFRSGADYGYGERWRTGTLLLTFLF